jgi:hypothetical protein
VLSREKEVCGFQVPMDDSSGVRLRYRFERLQNEIDGFDHWHRAARLEERREICSLEILEYHEGQTAFELPHIEDARSVLAMNTRRGSGFVKKSRHSFCVNRSINGQELQRDALLKKIMAGCEDGAHSALTKEPLNSVFARNHVARAGQTAGACVEGIHCVRTALYAKAVLRLRS